MAKEGVDDGDKSASLDVGATPRRSTSSLGEAVRVLAGINVLLWGAFIWIGRSLIHNLAGRAVPGYPNHGQMTYYLYFPMAMLTLALSAYAIGRVRKLRYVGLGVEVLVLVVFAPFFLGYIGGM